jgi:tetratricopeptide (TPR) repeat protein
LLETIREYALEQLARRGDEPEARRRHAMYFLEIAERAEPVLTIGGDGLVALLDELARTHDDFRAVLAWAAEAGELELEVRLAAALRQYWLVRGELREGRDYFDSLIARCAEPGLRALVLGHGGIFHFRLGQPAAAKPLWEEALALNRRLGDRDELGRCLGELAGVAIAMGDYERAVALYDECTAIYRDLGQEQRLAQALANLGAVAMLTGDLEESIRYGDEAIALQRARVDLDTLSISLHNRGHAKLALGDTAGAEADLAESFTLAVSLGYREVIAYCLGTTAELALARNDPLQAAQLVGASDAEFAAIGVALTGEEREARQRLHAAVADALGAEQSETSRRAGAALPHKELVEPVLGPVPSALRT